MRLKNIIVLLIACFTSTLFVSAQKKYFEEALKQGKNKEGYYQGNIPSKKRYKSSEILDYAESKNYIVRHYASTGVLRFGEIQSVVTSFIFIKKEEVEEYVLKSILEKTNSRTKLSLIVNKGTGIIYDPARMETYKTDNIYWSGKIIDGKISGTGTGVYVKDGYVNVFEVTKGGYEAGVLNGEAKYYVTMYNFNNFDNLNIKKDKILMESSTEGFYTITRKIEGYTNEYGFVDVHSGLIAVPFITHRIVKPFNRGKAVVINDERKEIIINTKGEFIDYTREQKQKDRLYAQEKKKQMREFSVQNTINNAKVIYEKDSLEIYAYFSFGEVFQYKEELFYPHDKKPMITFKVASLKKNNGRGKIKPHGDFEISTPMGKSITKSSCNCNQIKVEITEGLVNKIKSNYINLTFWDNSNSTEKHVADSILVDFIPTVMRQHKVATEQNEREVQNMINERKKGFYNIKEGDILVYSTSWEYTTSSGFWIWRTTSTNSFKSITYLVVTKILEEGRIQAVVNKTTNTESGRYKENQYNGLKLTDGTTIYLDKHKLAYDTRFKKYEP